MEKMPKMNNRRCKEKLMKEILIARSAGAKPWLLNTQSKDGKTFGSDSPLISTSRKKTRKARTLVFTSLRRELQINSLVEAGEKRGLTVDLAATQVTTRTAIVKQPKSVRSIYQSRKSIDREDVGEKITPMMSLQNQTSRSIQKNRRARLQMMGRPDLRSLLTLSVNQQAF